MLRAAGWIVVAMLLGVAGFEVVLALGLESGAPRAGADPRGLGIALLVAALAMLAGVGLGVAYAFRPTIAGVFICPAAGAVLLAFVYTYDPYYAPALQRYVVNMPVSKAWVVGVVALCVVAGWLALRPRGAIATSLLLPVVFLTMLVAGDGH